MSTYFEHNKLLAHELWFILKVYGWECSPWGGGIMVEHRNFRGCVLQGQVSRSLGLLYSKGIVGLQFLCLHVWCWYYLFPSVHLALLPTKSWHS